MDEKEEEEEAEERETRQRCGPRHHPLGCAAEDTEVAQPMLSPAIA